MIFNTVTNICVLMRISVMLGIIFMTTVEIFTATETYFWDLYYFEHISISILEIWNHFMENVVEFRL